MRKVTGRLISHRDAARELRIVRNIDSEPWRETEPRARMAAIDFKGGDQHNAIDLPRLA